MFFRSAHSTAVFAVVFAAPAAVRADFVTDWTQVAVAATQEAAQDPNAAARTLALVQLSIHDALALVDHTHAVFPDSLSVPIEGPISGEAAAAAAGHHVLTTLFPDQAAALSDELDEALQAVAAGEARDHGVALGEAVAEQVLTKLLQPLTAPDGGVDSGAGDGGAAGDAGPVDAGPPPPPPGPKTPGKPVTKVNNGCSLGATPSGATATSALWLAVLSMRARRRRRSS